jgi:hypothetical protein
MGEKINGELGCLKEFYESLTLFYTKMSFKSRQFFRRNLSQSFKRAIYLPARSCFFVILETIKSLSIKMYTGGNDQ